MHEHRDLVSELESEKAARIESDRRRRNLEQANMELSNVNSEKNRKLDELTATKTKLQVSVG